MAMNSSLKDSSLVGLALNQIAFACFVPISCNQGGQNYYYHCATPSYYVVFSVTDHFVVDYLAGLPNRCGCYYFALNYFARGRWSVDYWELKRFFLF